MGNFTVTTVVDRPIPAELFTTFDRAALKAAGFTICEISDNDGPVHLKIYDDSNNLRDAFGEDPPSDWDKEDMESSLADLHPSGENIPDVMEPLLWRRWWFVLQDVLRRSQPGEILDDEIFVEISFYNSRATYGDFGGDVYQITRDTVLWGSTKTLITAMQAKDPNLAWHRMERE